MARGAGGAHRHVWPCFHSWVFRSTLSHFSDSSWRVGLVVDDAIVVVEAVEHHIEEGMTPKGGELQKLWKEV